jgi:hypothetical protein
VPAQDWKKMKILALIDSFFVGLSRDDRFRYMSRHQLRDIGVSDADIERLKRPVIY